MNLDKSGLLKSGDQASEGWRNGARRKIDPENYFITFDKDNYTFRV